MDICLVCPVPCPTLFFDLGDFFLSLMTCSLSGLVIWSQLLLYMCVWVHVLGCEMGLFLFFLNCWPKSKAEND